VDWPLEVVRKTVIFGRAQPLAIESIDPNIVTKLESVMEIPSVIPRCVVETI
jgi:hypothetical protein